MCKAHVAQGGVDDCGITAAPYELGQRRQECSNQSVRRKLSVRMRQRDWDVCTPEVGGEAPGERPSSRLIRRDFDEANTIAPHRRIGHGIPPIDHRGARTIRYRNDACERRARYVARPDAFLLP